MDNLSLPQKRHPRVDGIHCNISLAFHFFTESYLILLEESVWLMKCKKTIDLWHPTTIFVHFWVFISSHFIACDHMRRWCRFLVLQTYCWIQGSYATPDFIKKSIYRNNQFKILKSCCLFCDLFTTHCERIFMRHLVGYLNVGLDWLLAILEF